jgi:hypothetical protein
LCNKDIFIFQKKYDVSSGSSDESSDSDTESEKGSVISSSSSSNDNSSSSSSSSSESEGEEKPKAGRRKTPVISSDSEPDDAVDAAGSGHENSGGEEEEDINMESAAEEQDIIEIQDGDDDKDEAQPDTALVDKLAAAQRAVIEIVNEMEIGAEVTVSDLDSFSPPPPKSPTFYESPGGIVTGVTYIPHPKKAAAVDLEGAVLTPPTTPKNTSTGVKKRSSPSPVAGCSSARNHTPVHMSKKAKRRMVILTSLF